MMTAPMVATIFDYTGLFGTLINIKNVYSLSICTFIISLMLMMPCLVCKIIEKIEEFPSSCLYIG